MAVFGFFKDRNTFWFLSALVLIILSHLVPTVRSSDEQGQWWTENACATIRNARHQENRDLFQTLNDAIKRVNENILKMKSIFAVSEIRTHPIRKFDWLKFPKFNKKALNKTKKKDEQALKEFHKALQIYAGTINTLKNHSEIIDITKNNDNEQIHAILGAITYELKKLMCEVEKKMFDWGIPLKILQLEDMNINLGDRLSASNAHTVYISVFNNLKGFLKRSRRIMFTKLMKRRKSLPTSFKDARGN